MKDLPRSKGPSNRPVRSPLLGALLIGIGILTIIIGVVLSRYFKGSIGQAFVQASATSFGVFFIARGRQLRTRDATIAISEGKSLIVYLRGFDTDSSDHLIAPRRVSWALKNIETNEDLFSQILRRFGRFVALGRPGDRLAPVGADRAYVSDSTWQDEVLKMLKAAEFIILRIGTTPGLIWEIKTAIGLASAQRIILFVPLPIKMRGKKREEAYERIRIAIQDFFPRGLPTKIDKAIFIAFTETWDPIVLGTSVRDLTMLESSQEISRPMAAILKALIKPFSYL